MSSRVVVLGAGYVGTCTAKALEECGDKFSITVVDRQETLQPNHHRLGEVRAMVNGGSWVERERVPLTQLFEKTTKCVVGDVCRIDHSAKRLVFSPSKTEKIMEPLAYDVLVVATGSPNHLPGELPTHLLGRDEVREYFEETARAIQKANRIVIVGGTVSAVEYATEIRSAYPKKKEIRIVTTATEGVNEANNHGRKASFVQSGYLNLAAKQIDVTRGERVVSPEWKAFAGKRFLVGPISVQTDKGSSFDTDLVLWASTWNTAVGPFAIEWLNDSGQLVCRDTFQLVECDDVFAVGGISSVMGADVYSTASMIQWIPMVISSIRRVVDMLKQPSSQRSGSFSLSSFTGRGSNSSSTPIRKSQDESTPPPPAPTTPPSRRLFRRMSSSNSSLTASTNAPENLLFNAIRQKDWEKTSGLISRGEGISYVDHEFGMSVLHMAVTVNAPVRVINMLLQKGCDANQRDNISCTPVHIASGRNVDAAVLEALLDAGGDPNLVSDDGLTPVGLAAQNSAAPNLLRALLDAGGVALRPRDKDGATPLWLASSKGAPPRVIKMLLDAGADVNAEMHDGSTPVWIACHRNASPATLKALLDSGGSPTKRNVAGVSPLAAALASKANVGLIKVLLDSGSIDVNKQRENGPKRSTPLICAVMSGAPLEVAELLLSKGADPSLQDADGKSAIDHIQGRRGALADSVRSALVPLV